MRFDLNGIRFSDKEMKDRFVLPEKPSEELAEEIGLHIGDGTMNFYKKGDEYKGSYALRGHLKDDRLHYETRIKDLYKVLFNYNASLREMKSTGVFGFQKQSDSLVNFKRRLGLSLGKKIDIDIPKFILGNESYIKSVLRGIFDTDGTIYFEHKNNKLYPRIIIGTISQKLALRLRKLIFKSHINSTLYKEARQHKGWNDLFIISVRGETMLHKWMETVNPATQNIL